MKLFCFLISLILTARANERHKRDNGGAFSDSGGPVAQESKGGNKNNGGVEVNLELQKYLAALDPCEAKLQETLTNSSIVSVGGHSITEGASNAVGKTVNTDSLGLGRKKRQFDFPGFSGFSNASSSSVDEQFKKFTTYFNKVYPTSQDRDKAFENFKNNLKTLFSLLYQRRSPYDATFTITKFMDLDFSTFLGQHAGAIPPTDSDDKHDKPLTLDLSILDTVGKVGCKKMNWTSLDIVPEVRLQDKCGCCYAMSTADLIATQYSIDNKAFNKHYQLSAQWLTDCMQQPAAFQCNGGRPVKVLEALAKDKTLKIPTESCYPYLDKNNTCSVKNCSDTPPINVTLGRMLDVRGIHEMDLVATLLQHGPLVAIVGITESWQMYNGSGIMRAHQCTEKQNHAVLITGYDYTGCVPTYYVKNSWGKDWGYEGHIKLEAGKNTCGVAKSIVFTCTSDNKCATDPIKHVLSTVLHPDCKKLKT